uniref:Uncharacterized protein n=1 Tax=Meloidogyne enterolobii TaxID=390850 RepID=A0A6V7U1X5_MELEN|nr:unnamed protein product [Meloidogyne enterolobii]
MVLVERYGKDNGIKNIFYSKINHGFECLKDHRCGKRHELKEVHPSSKTENGVKLKQNKLFQECAVKRDNNIETLVKHVELSPTQILFFSKGEHVYHAGLAQIKQNCEKDKAAKMKIPPVKHITLVLRGEKKNKIVWKDYEEFNSNKKSVVMVIKPFLGSTNRHCSAMAANHYYQIFLCRKEVCGGHGKLFLMRKLKSQNKEQPKLMKMDEGEDVHVTHIFTVEQKSEVIDQIIKRCKGTEHVIEGVTYKAPSASKKQHPNNKKPDHIEQQKHNEAKPEHHEEHKDNSKLKDNSKHKENSKHLDDSKQKPEHHEEHKDDSKHIDDSKHKESNKKVEPVERRGRINSPNNKLEDKKEESHQAEKEKGEKGQKDNKIAEHSGQKDGHQPNSLKNPKSSHLEEEKIKHKENINSNIEKPVSDLKDGTSVDKEGEKKNEVNNLQQNFQNKFIETALNNKKPVLKLLMDNSPNIKA